MRLWHQDLIPYLPLNQLRGENQECCSLRGKNWGRKHVIVNYVFKYNYLLLWRYHLKIINEILKRKPHYNFDTKWFSSRYRGRSLGFVDMSDLPNFFIKFEKNYYIEHNDKMLEENLNNLKYGLNDKGKVKNIDLFKFFPDVKDYGKYDKEYWLEWFEDL